MKKIFSCLLIIILIGLLVWFLNGLINKKIDQLPADNSKNNIEQTSDQNSTQQTTTDSDAKKITTIIVGQNQQLVFPATGTVISTTLNSIFPAISGTISKINFAEGDYVKKGEIIIELTGNSGTQHQNELQYQVALQNFQNAQNSYQNLLQSSALSADTATLQYQSAINQANSLLTDLQSMNSNIATLSQNLNLAENSLQISRQKIESELSTAQIQLDDLNSQINKLQSQKMNLLNSENSESEEIKTSILEIETTLQELYLAYDKASQAMKSAIASANQGDLLSVSQLNQTASQLRALELSKISLEQKAGLSESGLTAVQLAETAWQTAQLQLKNTLDQAKIQLEIAKINFDLAELQHDQLKLKAPVDGLISGLNFYIGQSVSPQQTTPLFAVLTPGEFILETNVDQSTAMQINQNANSQVEIGGQWINAKINSVSQIPDARSRQFKVKIALPKIYFNPGQLLNVRLPLRSTSLTNAILIPLDAVTIATQEKFVFIKDGDQAKKINVTTGQIQGDYIEILSGLKTGDELIVTGAKTILDGEKVTL